MVRPRQDLIRLFVSGDFEDHPEREMMLEVCDRWVAEMFRLSEFNEDGQSLQDILDGCAHTDFLVHATDDQRRRLIVLIDDPCPNCLDSVAISKVAPAYHDTPFGLQRCRRLPDTVSRT